MFSNITSADFVAIAIAMAGVLLAYREMRKQSELSNFDFWTQEGAKPLIEGLSKLSHDYMAAPDVKKRDVDSRILNTVEFFMIQTDKKYRGIVVRRRLNFWSGDWGGQRNSLMPHTKALRLAYEAIEDAITEGQDAHIVLQREQEAVFALGEFISHIRSCLAHGQGLFHILIIPRDYTRYSGI